MNKLELIIGDFSEKVNLDANDVVFLEYNLFGNLTGFEIVSGELVGDDECFDIDEFYQYLITVDGVYKCYFKDKDENGESISLDDVNYYVSYRQIKLDDDTAEIVKNEYKV